MTKFTACEQDHANGPCCLPNGHSAEHWCCPSHNRRETA